MTPEVVAALLAEAERSRNPENAVAFRLLAATGTRRGEICALRWSSVDLESGRIEIRAATAQLMSSEVREKDPKSHQIREVRVDSRTLDILREHQTMQRDLATQLGETLAPEAFVLADFTIEGTGRAPTLPNLLTQAFGQLRERVPAAQSAADHIGGLLDSSVAGEELTDPKSAGREPSGGVTRQ